MITTENTRREYRTACRLLLLCNCLFAGPALAAGQDQPDAARETQAAQNSELGEVVVTGTRLRTGFQAPTPVTVASAEQLQKSDPTGIAEGLNQLPQFAGSQGPQASLASIATAQRGNYLNLRNIGANRVLILQDGMRVPAATSAGLVDVDVIPEMLVSRVETVTGGVSAVYGSDAISGVVNYILDKKFTGFKGVAQSGISAQGDGARYRLGAAFGAEILNDRGHVSFSVERSSIDAISKADRGFTRAYYGAASACQPGVKLADGSTCPAAGTAGNKLSMVPNAVAPNTSETGPLFNAGPAGVVGFTVTRDGQPMKFLTVGDPGVRYASPNAQIGGSGDFFPLVDLTSGAVSNRAFGRFGYDVSDKINFFVEGNLSKTVTSWKGANNAIVLAVFADNAFLPQPFKDILTATPTTASATAACGKGTPAAACIQYTPDHLGLPHQEQEVKSYSVKTGFTGEVNAFGSDWDFNLAYAYGDSRLDSIEAHALEREKVVAALDAVRAPSGEIVCRANLVVPGSRPGCIPLNPFISTPGAQSQALVDYLYNDNTYSIVNTSNDLVFNLSGSPFSTWAGPVAVSAGAEYRTGSLVQVSNGDPAVARNITGLRGIATNDVRFAVPSVGAARGQVKAWEANAEILIPLAENLPFAHSLSVTGAARYTDYSTSGGIWSWKAGATWEPVPELRFRVTRSRDIRAPTLFDLYSGQTQTRATVFDPHTGINPPIGVEILGGGNPNLVPEIADTWTAGAILQVPFVRNLTLSVDYYKIKMRDNLAALSAANVLADCEAANGVGSTCALIERPLPFSDRSPANVPSRIFAGTINAAALKASGLDFELTYRTPLHLGARDGDLTARLMASYVIDRITQARLTDAAFENAGYDGENKIRGVFNLNYAEKSWAFNIQERYIGKVHPSTNTAQGIRLYDFGDVPAVLYTDITLDAFIETNVGRVNLFATVNNLFDKQPPIYATYLVRPGVLVPGNQAVYDSVGRFFTVGARLGF